MIVSNLTFMKRLFFALTVVLGLPFTMNAQGNSSGIKFGVNLLSQKWEVGSLGDNTIIGTSFHVGFYGKYGIGGTAYIQPEILYKSLKATEDDNDITLNYLSVPLMFVYEFQPHVNIQAGPQIGILVTSDPDELKDEDAIKGMDFSFNVGVGADFKRASVTARYCIGLTNIAGEELQDEIQNLLGEDLSIKNNYFQISLGIRLFGGGNETEIRPD